MATENRRKDSLVSLRYFWVVLRKELKALKFKSFEFLDMGQIGASDVFKIFLNC